MSGKRLYAEEAHTKLGAKYAARVVRFAKKLAADAIREGVDTHDLTLVAFNSMRFAITMSAIRAAFRRKAKRR